MPWIHDQKENVLLCISEKHNRKVEINLINPVRNCYECWRACFFWLDKEGYITVRFKAEKGDADVERI